MPSAYEISRQSACLKSGEAIVLHTRLWDPDKCITVFMRGKFEGPCVPDPSVPQIAVTEEWKNGMRARLPEMPGSKAERFSRQYGLTREEAVLMSAERDVSEYFEEVVKNRVPPRTGRTGWPPSFFPPSGSAARPFPTHGLRLTASPDC